MDNLHARKAFSLVELVLVLTIIGILVSLLMVGVQWARESARRMSCLNNLRQIGLAFSNYEAAYRALPRGVGNNGYGPLVAILPYIEQQQLYNGIDLSLHIADNTKAMKTKVALYRCPSTLSPDTARTDYVFNRGTTLDRYRNSPWFFEERIYPRFSQFSRGLSLTALMAETCPNISGQRPGTMLALPKRDILTESDSDAFIYECDSQSWNSPRHPKDNGDIWLGGGVANYYHIFTPNYKSCANGGLDQFSLQTTNSMHTGGANVMFADGHVELFADSTDRTAWMQLGVR